MASERDANANPYVSPASPPRGQDPRDWEPLVPGEVLRIQGVLSPKDLFAANKLRGKDKPSDGFSAASLFLFFFLGTLGAAIGVHFAFIILVLIFLALALGFAYAALRAARRIDRYWRDQRGVFRPQQIEITEQGIRQQTEEISAAYRWNVFATHTASKRVVILDFDPPQGPWCHSTFGCLVIPREFFLCDADWDRFVRLVRRKLPKRYREGRWDKSLDPHGLPGPEVAAGSEPDLQPGEAGSRGETIRIGGTISPKDLFGANRLAHQEKPSDAIVAVAILFLVAAICARHLANAQKRAADFNIPAAYHDVAALLDRAKPDVLDIATPPEVHREQALMAADRGIDILCQKPMTPDLAESTRLVAEVGDRVRFMVHENWRFRPQYRQAARWLEEDRLGTLREFHLTTRSSGLVTPAAGGTPFALERQPFMAGLKRFIIMELLVHHLDTARYLAGPVSVAAASTARTSAAVIGEDAALISLNAAGGAFGTVVGNFCAAGFPPLPSDRLELIGDRGSIIFEGSRLRLLGESEEILDINLEQAYQQSYDNAIAHFVKALQQDTPFETDRLDNLQTLQLVEEAYRKAEGAG